MAKVHHMRMMWDAIKREKEQQTEASKTHSNESQPNRMAKGSAEKNHKANECTAKKRINTKSIEKQTKGKSKSRKRKKLTSEGIKRRQYSIQTNASHRPHAFF